MAATADFTAIQITLTSAATAYNLYTLLAAVDSTCPIRACEVTIQPETATNAILIGDKSISATRYGHRVQAQTTDIAGVSEVLVFRHQKNTIQLKSIYLWALTTDNMKVNVCVWTC